MARQENGRFPQEWAWKSVGADEAWRLLNQQKPIRHPVLVALIDSGIAHDHQDLREYLLPPETVLRDGDTRDDDDHGTLVAGTIVAACRPVLHPSILKILSVKFCSQQAWPSPARASDAICRAIDRLESRPGVIVLAWDVAHGSPALDAAIEKAGEADAVVVVAAGNMSLDNDKHKNWPASHGDRDHVITVMATDRHNERASFSNYGEKTVHVAAPGTDILSTAPYVTRPAFGSTIPSGYRVYRGSSAAAAHVAGLAALIRAQKPLLTSREVKQLLGRSATPLQGLKRRYVGKGVINYLETVRHL
jgi:subtilisin family serine protease